MPQISVVIPIMNEADNIAPLLKQIKEALNTVDYEVILVDDGSTDNTVEQIKQHSDAHTKLLELRMNYGQSSAMAAGIDHAIGDFIVTMDGDLQNDPNDIPVLLDKIQQEDWDMVAGYRKNRKDNMLFRKVPSNIANYIIRKMTGVKIKDYGCTLKIMRKEIAQDIGLYGELHRFIPALAKQAGARIAQIDVNHYERFAGKTKYGLGRSFKVISDLLLILFLQRFMQKPMHIFGFVGLAAFSIGVLINLYLLGLKIAGMDIWGKPLLILGVILLIGGIQFLTIGIFLEVLVRTYFESQDKKTYRVRNIFSGAQTQMVGENG